MSRSYQETIACPSCGEGQPFIVWESVNVSVDPELKQSLLEGTLTTLRCRRCRHEAHIAYDCLYHDMGCSLAVWLKYQEADGMFSIDPAARAMFPSFVHNYTCRLVPSFHELVDKIRIFDDGFSDHTIELLKLLICIREGIDTCCSFHYAGVESSWLKGKSLVFALQSDQGFVEKKYPLKRYLDAVQPLVPRIAPIINNPSDEWPHVDRAYMLRALEACGLMRALDEAGRQRL